MDREAQKLSEETHIETLVSELQRSLPEE
jgi:hypothetical protein